MEAEDLYGLGETEGNKQQTTSKEVESDAPGGKRKRSAADEPEAAEKTYETMGPLILGDLIKSFQLWLDSRMWRNVRLSVSAL